MLVYDNKLIILCQESFFLRPIIAHKKKKKKKGFIIINWKWLRWWSYTKPSGLVVKSCYNSIRVLLIII